MRPILWRALAAVPLLFLTTGALQAQGNVASATDHPLLHRAEGSRVTQKEVKTDHTCDLPTGAVEGNRFSDTREFRGRVTTITYVQRQGRSVGDVYRELEQQLLGAGIRVYFKCKDGNCGKGTGPANFCAPAWRGANGQMQLTGEIPRPGSSLAVVSLHVQAPDNRERAVAHLTLIESDGPTWTGVGAGVTPGSKATTFSTSALLSTGRVALPEPLFQSKSSALRAEATPVLADIAQFLKQNPGVNVIVANTTSGNGWLKNITLSRDRAAAITAALTSRYGIAANRMKAQGSASGTTNSGDSQTQLILDR